MPRDRARWEPVARRVAAEAGIDPDLFVAQVTRESSWDTEALSPSGAVGLVQIIPKWHPTANVHDPEANLRYAAKLMASHIREFGSEAMALRAYSGGPSVIRKTGKPATGTERYSDSILAGREVLRKRHAPVLIALAETGYPPEEAAALIRAASALSATAGSMAQWVEEIGALRAVLAEREVAKIDVLPKASSPLTDAGTDNA